MKNINIKIRQRNSKSKLLLLPLLLCGLLTIGAVILFNMTNVQNTFAYNEHYSYYGIANVLEEEMLFNPEPNAFADEGLVFVPFGDSNWGKEVPIGDDIVITNYTYIPNSDFFLRSPSFMRNDSSAPGIPSIGVCTTVAAQKLINYHHFFTDRRMIPSMHNGNSTNFLHNDFGNLNYWPSFQVADGITRDCTIEVFCQHTNRRMHCMHIGTTDTMFWSLLDRLGLTRWTQDPLSVRRRMNSFLNTYYRDANGNSLNSNVTLGNWQGLHNVSGTIRNELAAGRPVIAGIRFSAASYHYVVVYGQGYHNGVRGFIAHWGWHGEDMNHVWFPQNEVIGYITMRVDNITHNFVNTGEVITSNNRPYKVEQCTITGVRRPQATLIFDPIIGTNNVSVRPRQGAILPATLNIPSTVVIGGTTRTVTEIAASAFLNRSSITAVSLPSTLTTIGWRAFAGTGLTSIYIPASVRYIHADAFSVALLLNEVTFGENSRLRVIEDRAFSSTSLTSIEIPPGVEVIGFAAFAHINTLKSISLPFVGIAREKCNRHALLPCGCHFGYIFGALQKQGQGNVIPASLRTVSITNAVRLNNDAFYGIHSIQEIHLPLTILYLGANSLATNAVVHIPQGATVMPSNFFDNAGIRHVVIPNTVTTIHANAFAVGNPLQSVVFSDGSELGHVGSNAFANTALLCVALPAGVWYVGVNAFTVNTAVSWLGRFRFKGNTFLECLRTTNNTVLEIPLYIAGRAIKHIGDNAFRNMPANSRTIIIRRTDMIVSISANAFSDMPNLDSLWIYVPSWACVNAFRAAPGWSAVADRITTNEPPIEWDLFYESAVCLGHYIELDTPNVRLIIEFFDSDYSVSVSVGYYMLYMDVNTHIWINWFCYYYFRHATVYIHFINPLTLWFENRGGSEPNFNAKFSVRVYVPK